MKEQQVADLLFYSPMFLSTLTADQFIKILTAILLEKSVIFISDNLPLLSSAVLGMQQFLMPFKWCYVQIPILPRSLVDMIEAPMPILVGLLQSHVEFVPSLDSSQDQEMLREQGLISERLVVRINDETKSVHIDDSCADIPIPQFKNIIDHLITRFQVLNTSSSYIYNPTDK